MREQRVFLWQTFGAINVVFRTDLSSLFCGAGRCLLLAVSSATLSLNCSKDHSDDVP